MLLFRMGPRYLFIRTENIDETTKFFAEDLRGEIVDFDQGFEKASENSTLCFITDTNLEKTRVEDAKKIVLIQDVSTIILSSIVNKKACHKMDRVDMGPAFIVMRIAGNEEKLVEKLKDFFSGVEVSLIDGIHIGEKDDTIIAFTDKVITDPLAITDFLDKMILIHQPIAEVRDILRLEGLRLLTQSLDDSQWYELRINIYDSYGRYKENYDRLIFILSKLEIGMILGESWTKDFAVILYSVLTYQVRLFTFFTPMEVKKILMALEFSVEGRRMVDFDLYYKNKKILWYDVNKSKGRKQTKREEAMAYRQSLYEKLDPEDIETLEAMEKALLEMK